MIKKIMKFIIILCICISVNGLFYNVYSMNPSESSGKKETGIIDPDSYKPGSLDNPTGADWLMDKGNIIIGFLRIIGSITSVAVLIVLGIKYMMGSAEEKAEYKKSMVPYIVGAVMLFGITNILSIIVSIAKNLW